jgi:propanol-preferring alcohol dehydrogenase
VLRQAAARGAGYNAAMAAPEPVADAAAPAGYTAMAMDAPGRPLQAVWRAGLPVPGPGQVRLAVAACGVCRTDLHLVDGDLPHPGHPLVPGHEVVGRVAALGPGVDGLALGQRVGVPWLGWTCGTCPDCLAGRENLCPQARFTGWQLAEIGRAHV